MLPSSKQPLEDVGAPLRRDRNFPNLELTDPSDAQPLFVIQSPKTPTLSRKLKAVSLDSEPAKQSETLEVCRDVFSMPNTPKKQMKPRYAVDFDQRTLAPSFSSNLKRFASNSSISGSQTLKTLPEIMTLQDFSDARTEPVRIRTKGLLERRGSNASLTIDLSMASDNKPVPVSRLNAAKSVSNLNLTSIDTTNKCECTTKLGNIKEFDRRKSQTHLETCGNCTIYESIPSKTGSCKYKYRRCNCICNSKCSRKSLSNENLYVPPCSFCHISPNSAKGVKYCKGHRRACYPRQADLDTTQLLSEDFRMHLQNVQYLQTAGSMLSVGDLKAFSDMQRVPKLHQEFWEVPLNLQEKCLVSGSQTRNRYRGVLPNEHSRVHLSEQQPYIHANYIKGPDYMETAYIATQGPMLHTCEDFWEMVWTSKSNCVVMLTQLVEKGRNKCELYFPLGKSATTAGRTYFELRTTRLQDKFTFDSRHHPNMYEEETIRHEELNEVTYGCYRVCYVSKEVLGECVVRKLVLYKGVESRHITHYWYPSWQDHKMADPQQVLRIALHVLDFLAGNAKVVVQKKSPRPRAAAHSETRESSTFRANFEHFRKISGEVEEKKARKEDDKRCPPLVVHCSAGIGRTGCFIAILNGIQQLRSNFNVDVLAILCSLRLHRGGMVQTAEQYELIHRVLSLYTEHL